MNLKCSHCHFIVTLFIISQFNSSVNVQKPGFSDQSSIAAEIFLRNPVSHSHAIARSRIKSDRPFLFLMSEILIIIAPSLAFLHQQLPTPHRSELPLPPSDYQVWRSAIPILMLALNKLH
ncbi:hypothetical protein [Microcoleus anatoxicus]|uniref:hypothetical protein n=1 Tax=Microcoleus anatoxicus TaxID=2705319 RepID=UPI0030C9F2A0